MKPKRIREVTVRTESCQPASTSKWAELAYHTCILESWVPGMSTRRSGHVLGARALHRACARTQATSFRSVATRIRTASPTTRVGWLVRSFVGRCSAELNVRYAPLLQKKKRGNGSAFSMRVLRTKHGAFGFPEAISLCFLSFPRACCAAIMRQSACYSFREDCPLPPAV